MKDKLRLDWKKVQLLKAYRWWQGLSSLLKISILGIFVSADKISFPSSESNGFHTDFDIIAVQFYFDFSSV